MEELGIYDALSVGDEPGSGIWWLEGYSRATHALVREGQLPEKDTFVTVCGSLIAGVLAFGG